MELKHIRGSKSLKLLFLLLSSLLIASVSASIYYTMYMNATVGVAGNKIQFTEGNDFSTVGGSITDSGQKVTFTSMNGQIGSLATVSDPVDITNTDTSTPHNIELKLSAWTGNTQTHLNYINVTMYDGSTKKGVNIYLVPGESGQVSTTGVVSIPASTAWRVQWDIYWNGDATISDSVTVNLQLVVSS